MKKCVKINCYAKINLCLDVISRRNDGYHNLEMLMQSVGISDILDICADTSQSGIKIRCGSDAVPCGSDNLAARAAELFLDTAGIDAKVEIDIEKHIPVGAGLGGGSSDAAGTLSGLNTLFGSPLTVSELAAIAEKIGSDVPFFLYGGCMLATGTGTELKAVVPLKNAFVLIAKPEFHVSTPYVYKNLRLDEVKRHPDTAGAVAALENGDLNALAECSGNVLETVTAAEHGEIEEYKSVMLDCGAVYSLMSGSGPSVFGIFTDRSNAETAAEKLAQRTSEVFVTEPRA